MNANKQDAGGLPELPETIWLDSLAGRLYTADQMHAYGEQCRAASGVAGDVCATCQGHGMIGWTTGQTPEQFDQHEAPCPDCSANASPVAVTPGLIEALGHQQQCDEEGMMCIVSRQAVDEAIAILRALSRGVPEGK